MYTEEIAFLDDVLVDRHSANDAFATFLRPVDRPCHEEIGDRVRDFGIESDEISPDSTGVIDPPGQTRSRRSRAMRALTSSAVLQLTSRPFCESSAASRTRRSMPSSLSSRDRSRSIPVWYSRPLRGRTRCSPFGRRSQRDTLSDPGSRPLTEPTSALSRQRRIRWTPVRPGCGVGF